MRAKGANKRQNRKTSMRANVFRFAPKSGHCAIESACPFRANSGSEVARNHLHDAERYAMALQVHRGLPAIRKPFELNELRRQRRNDVAVSSLARIPDRFS